MPTPGNSINEATTGITGFTGTAFTGSPATQYCVQIGGATSNTLGNVGPGSAGQVLQSGGNAANPAYSTATYPSTATSTGTILRADGTNYVASTSTFSDTYTASNLLYSNGANTVTGLATANGGALTTSATGVPVITALANGKTLVGSASSATPVATYFTNATQTYVPSFNSIPVMSASTGGAAAVTISTTNVWALPQWGAYFEAFNATVATNIAPILSTTAGKGLNIDNIGASTNKKLEITEGNSQNTKNLFTIGTSPAFYIKVSFNIAVLADVALLTMGFRDQAAYQATLLTGYSDYACIGVKNTGATPGEIQIETQKNTMGETLTDTTQTATANTIFTVQVNVTSGGVVTYLFNGAPPTVTASYTFNNAATVIPFIAYISAAGGHAETDLVSYQCGFQ